MLASLLRTRRSIRKFLDRPVEPDKLDELVEMALCSPSSRGLDPWEFVVVTDRALLEQLSRAKPHGSSFLKKAPLGIVVCADSEKSDVWVEDASIAAILLHLGAHSLGLGSCWIQIRKRSCDEKTSSQAYVSDLLKLPEKMQVEAIVAIGYPDETLPPHDKSELKFGKVYVNQYGHRYRQ